MAFVLAHKGDHPDGRRGEWVVIYRQGAPGVYRMVPPKLDLQSAQNRNTPFPMCRLGNACSQGNRKQCLALRKWCAG
ncbi:hypothetical protein CEXT_165131 [Caerostris extrusa]|uniref:Uncharacterized protein n=1 Tax=Caerostris extrusa TaxID=172846 RepID=A0AAV4XTF1_CAEEX|nr:hypothetical protein CEXT_165131 [Caerostris extrusa]